ncbi:MAG TPA: DUF4339 domain-containing protein [Candidatus Dormibacteraeota bacterium]|nr:DUF4339 domain-containing protein [Candidatus Dormibacteraeota bacterium]
MYRIIGADGKEYGPISAEQVRQWMAEGRANAQTRVLLEGTSDWKTLGELPEFGGGASAAATPPPTFGAMPNVMGASGAAAEMVTGPAIGLIITGILNIVLAIANGVRVMTGAGMGMFPASGNADTKTIIGLMQSFGLVGMVLGILGGILILFGGLKMKKVENYGLCMAASIVAMIPCLSSCCLIGLPIGIWALVVISKPEVKSSFR